MNSILFCVNRRKLLVDMSVIFEHLRANLLYFEVAFAVSQKNMERLKDVDGFIHMSGKNQVAYVVHIDRIIKHRPQHYENKEYQKFKPLKWIENWKDDPDKRKWKNTLVISRIRNFTYDTLELRKCNGDKVTKAPQGYVNILSPVEWEGFVDILDN